MADPANPPVRPSPPPAPIDALRVAIVGTAAWFVAFLALLPCYGWLGRHDHRIWLWTALAGWVLGLAGTALTLKHRREGRAG